MEIYYSKIKLTTLPKSSFQILQHLLTDAAMIQEPDMFHWPSITWSRYFL